MKKALPTPPAKHPPVKDAPKTLTQADIDALTKMSLTQMLTLDPKWLEEQMGIDKECAEHGCIKAAPTPTDTGEDGLPRSPDCDPEDPEGGTLGDCVINGASEWFDQKEKNEREIEESIEAD